MVASRQALILTMQPLREWEHMPAIVNTAINLEKVMDFLVEAGFTPESIKDFNPSKEDQEQQTRRERMWGHSKLPAKGHERGIC